MHTQTILLDIEGTIAPLDFVKNVLFPYSLKTMDRFLIRHSERTEVQKILFETRQMVLAEKGYWIDVYDAEQELMNWVMADRKAPPLKRLQGLMWDEGYKAGELTSTLYSDVAPALQRWVAAGKVIGIYSSGSVLAQKAFFQHTTEGDLRPYISFWFDTENAGPKREAASYERILATLNAKGQDVAFCSDIGEELDAAAQAGLHTLQIIRPGTLVSGNHPSLQQF